MTTRAGHPEEDPRDPGPRSVADAEPATLDAANVFAQLPPSRVGAADRRYVNEVLDAGFGNWEAADMPARFERAFAAKMGTRFAISMNSGSGTLVACLLGAGVGPGDEVIVPTLTMAATAFAVIQCGAVPVFADSDPRTFTIDPGDVARRITPFTRALIPVSLYGLPPDFDAILALAAEHELAVIEDDAQCFLSRCSGQLVGTLGGAASFSFQGSKHMTSGGDGGMVVTSDPAYATAIRKAAVQGYRTLTGTPGRTMVPRDERQDWSYKRHDRLGYNFRMSAVQAALGLAQLERLEYLVAARRLIAYRYEQVIRELDCHWLMPPFVPPGRTHTYFTYACLLDEAALGTDWRSFRRTFIECGGDGLYGSTCPVHLEPVFQALNFYGTPARAPHFDPRYRGSVKGYDARDCPNVARLRGRLCLFKTNMQTLEKMEAEMAALAATIRHYGSRNR